jgi:transposase
MATDEKQTGEDMHTTVSNRKTGKTALMIGSLRYTDLQKSLNREDPVCREVETLTRDLSPLYAKAGSELFLNASPVADRFHIIRSLTVSCQDVRVRLRRDLLRERRIRYEAHKRREKERKKQCPDRGNEYVKQGFKYEERELSNGETALEALARSRCLPFKYPDDRTVKQRERACALFEKYPEIKTDYERSREFRNWMKKEHAGRSIRLIKDELSEWMKKVEQDGVDELLNFKSLIERNLIPVLNYFRFGATNAIAENINSKIQRFITINQGTGDREFFYFRMKKYFSSTSI